MLPFADGSDLSATAQPGNFCNVSASAQTPGRVPKLATVNGWQTLSTLGPIGRTSGHRLPLFRHAGPESTITGVDRRGQARCSNRPLKHRLQESRASPSRDSGGLPSSRASPPFWSRSGRFSAVGCVARMQRPI